MSHYVANKMLQSPACGAHAQRLPPLGIWFLLITHTALSTAVHYSGELTSQGKGSSGAAQSLLSAKALWLCTSLLSCLPFALFLEILIKLSLPHSAVIIAGRLQPFEKWKCRFCNQSIF